MKKLSSIAKLGSKFMAASAPVKAAVVIGSVAVVGGGTYGGVQVYHHITQGTTELVLLNDKIDLEYGLPLSEDAKDYVDVKKSNQEMLENAVVDLSGVTMNNDGYAEVGKYVIKITAGDKEYSIDLTVADTAAPTFKDGVTEIETAYATVPDYLSIFKVEDGSEFEVTVDDSAVNYEQAGTYSIKVSAKDKYGNETVLDNISVIVAEQEVASNTPSSSNTGSSNTSGGSTASQSPSNNSGSSSGSSSSSGSNSGSTGSTANNNSSSESSQSGNNQNTDNTEVDEWTQKYVHDYDFPYELYVLTTYEGHYGFFKTNDTIKEATLAPILYPEGGEGKEFLVGYYNDVGVSFMYNDDNPNNPLK